MIPNVKILAKEITKKVYPNRTYKINFEVINNRDTGIVGEGIVGYLTLGKKEPVFRITRLTGFVDGLDAIKQAIYLILSTERYKHVIYSWDYGVELADLIGKPMPYVMAEVPRRITEALIQDNRIKDVVDFNFDMKGNKLHVTFTVVTNVGNIPTKLEVDV